jgi:hypothetical protein
VAAELPLLGRRSTRAAGLAFDWSQQRGGKFGKRVLRVFGPPQSGKSYTLSFFQYLAAIQPGVAGVLHADFGDPEMITQAAGANVPIELYLARRLEAQSRRRREELTAAAPQPATDNALPDLAALLSAREEIPYSFQPLTDLQQRNRWVKELVGEFVNQVLFRANQVPRWWVLVFDNCGKAPPEAQEFVRKLVERAAGTGPTDVDAADQGWVRVALLGESAAMLPSPVYEPHLLEDDLEKQQYGVEQVVEYFKVLALCRAIDLTSEQLKTLADECLIRANDILAAPDAPPRPQAFAKAVLEKTVALEALAAQKRGMA